MNILMLNPVHPDTPHISAVRAWRFAQELAKLGHRVVLLTAAGRDGKVTQSIDANHDWRKPFVFACAGTTRSSPAVGSRLLRTLRRARTALRMVLNGGESAVWVRAAQRAGTAMQAECLPGVIWCTFGQLEGVFAAKRIARRLHRPWVLDVKDSWELYVPSTLRRLIAWRVRGFAAATANACISRRLTHRWLGATATLIYSGVDDCFFAPDEIRAADRFEINLVGGIYLPNRLHEFLAGVAMWRDRLAEAEKQQVCLRYIGAQTELVRESVQQQVPGLALEVPGYIPQSDMARRCQCAAVNAYIQLGATFHHKLLELLACGRPVMAYPSESDESIALARGAPGQLLVASTPNAVAEALLRLSKPFFEGQQPRTPIPVEYLRRYAWPNQTLLLQQELAKVAAPQ